MSIKKTLTPREIEIAAHVAFGYEPKQISKKLGITVKTVEAYQNKIYRTLGIQTRGQLIRYVIQEEVLQIQ
ncbi:MAG TPA: helix-turn-helix transcriptional regulator [Candidatus Manganitrophaceae bacterium]|nr:helix-turn-helix transcriptional regulator [Candidatus Manganitrophaceae bacterium]